MRLSKLCPPIQSPKSPVYNAGVRPMSRLLVTPAAFCPCIVAPLSACTEGSRVLERARRETNAVDHAGNEGEPIVPVALGNQTIESCNRE